MTPLLHKHLARQHIGTWRAFHRLDAEQQRTVEAAFRVHLRACRRSGIPADPHFLPELIGDVRSGVYFREMA